MKSAETTLSEQIAAIFEDGFDSTDQQQAEPLFSIYLNHGTDQAVFDYCQDNGLPGTKPSIAKMRRRFGWGKQREKVIKSQFAASPNTGDMLVDCLVAVENQLALLKKEMDATEVFNKAVHLAFGRALADKVKIVMAIRKTSNPEKTLKAMEKAKPEMSKEDLMAFIKGDIYGL